MAVTKIHSIKSTLHKSVAYICNPEKTDGQILISSFACSPQTAEYDFRFALSKTKGSDPNLAYHLIQSFAPGEVSFKEAHAIGVELADQLLQGKYSYIVTTHIDKEHCHNHILFCAADNKDHRKYHDCRETYRHIRKLSDKLCQEHNLSVIIPGQEQGLKYNEWEAKKKGESWKEKMRRDINDAIAQSSSYEIFLELLRSRGYEIKGENPDDSSSKYIAFRPVGKERFVRGSAKSLGTEFTRERIIQRIEKHADTLIQEQMSKFRKKHPIPINAPLLTALIQISEEKLKNSPGLRAWQERQNLKIAAQVFAATESFAELEAEAESYRKASKEAHDKIVNLDKEIKTLKEIIYYVNQYEETLPVEKRYQEVKNKELFERKHHTELRLHEGACVVLQRYGIKITKNMNAALFQEKMQRLQMQQRQVRQELDATEQAAQAVNAKRQILEQYLDRECANVASLKKSAPEM